MALVVAEDVYAGPTWIEDPVAFWCRRWWEYQRLVQGDAVVVLDVPAATASALPVAAYVDGGRWIADCSNPVCFSAQIISPADPRYFCPDCENAHVGGAFAAVLWPSPDQVKQIAARLDRRPLKHTRNWFPTETADDLARENLEHGIPA